MTAWKRKKVAGYIWPYLQYFIIKSKYFKIFFCNTENKNCQNKIFKLYLTKIYMIQLWKQFHIFHKVIPKNKEKAFIKKMEVLICLHNALYRVFLGNCQKVLVYCIGQEASLGLLSCGKNLLMLEHFDNPWSQ
jgi:hypothetical protein